MAMLLLPLLWLCLLNVVTGETKRPNFIIMYMDDMGWGDLGVYGHPARETPNLDRLAGEGMLFTDWYTGSAICSPSRACLMTGRLPIRNGFYSDTQFARNSYSPQEVLGGIADDQILFPEVLKENGYKNKIVGKWHLGHRDEYLPLRHGFDSWFGAPNCHYKYDNVVIPNIPVYKDHLMQGRYYDDFKFDHETGIGNMTQLYIKEALEFLEERNDNEDPFLLYWAVDATHTPVYASKEFRGRSQRGLYGDAVMEIDYGVGRIMDKLRELKMDKNTFVFFSSDNGAATYALDDGGSNGPFLCGKQTTFEGGYRQPAIAWWPGKIPANVVSHQVGKMMDLFPTVLDMAGIPLPKNHTLDGESMYERMVNNSKPVDRPVFYYRGQVLFKVRYGQYKANFYTWGSPPFAQKLDYHYCPGQYVANVTEDEMQDHTKQPLMFHLGRDPGERWLMDPNTDEYKKALDRIMIEVREHKKSMVKAKPEFNMCDLAVQNWAPNGCEKIKRCLPIPESIPYQCDWPY